MENGAYSQDPENGTELNLVEQSVVKTSGKQKKGEEFTNQSKNNEHEHSTKDHSKKENEKSKTNSDYITSTTAGGHSGQDPSAPGPSSSCKPEVCQRARERYTAPDLRGSPWHRTKTIFLLATIGSLVVWAIIYSTLSQLDIV